MKSLTAYSSLSINKLNFSILTGSLLLTSSIHAAELEITITNATKNIYFTPLLIASHPNSQSLFHVGTSASEQLKSMAEGGDISGLSSLISNAGGNVTENPASGILDPGQSTTTTINTTHNHLSLSAMLLPTNDGFVGLDSWEIPSNAGTYTIMLNGYDAGTEANDELSSSMPNPPFITFGLGGTGVETSIHNNKVHIHPGTVGDTNPTGGQSDLSSTDHRWLNPVAIMTVTVK